MGNLLSEISEKPVLTTKRPLILEKTPGKSRKTRKNLTNSPKSGYNKRVYKKDFDEDSRLYRKVTASRSWCESGTSIV